MMWDYDSTVQNTLWITGGQWAGKTTVSGILAERYGLTHYHYDFHTMRGHEDRRIAAQVLRGAVPAQHDFEAMWVGQSPRRMADEARADLAQRFPWALDDLRGLVSPVPIIADGWGLRPDLVMAVTSAPERMVVLVPTDGWRQRQAVRLPRATRVSADVSDPELAQRNRIERDRLLATDAVTTARDLGIRVIEVDGGTGAEATADIVADHFAAFLPRRLSAVA